MERQTAIEHVYRFFDELGQCLADPDGASRVGRDGNLGHGRYLGCHALSGHDHQTADQPLNISI